jgi:hypothetical protein
LDDPEPALDLDLELLEPVDDPDPPDLDLELLEPGDDPEPIPTDLDLELLE